MKAKAFTLLEVLIAITIFTVCISVVYSLYASVISVVNNVENQAADNGRVRIAFEQMSNDLSVLYRGKKGRLLAREADSAGSEDAFLEFVSSNHLFFNPEETPVALTMIRYYLRQNDQDQSVTLLRSDSPILPGIEAGSEPEGHKIVLCEDLLEVKVVYVDSEGQEFSEWDTGVDDDEQQGDENRLPVLVLIDLVFPDDVEYSTSVFLRPALLKFAE